MSRRPVGGLAGPCPAGGQSPKSKSGVFCFGSAAFSCPESRPGPKALSADAGTKHGTSSSFVVYDELAQAPNRNLFDVLATSSGVRGAAVRRHQHAIGRIARRREAPGVSWKSRCHSDYTGGYPLPRQSRERKLLAPLVELGTAIAATEPALLSHWRSAPNAADRSRRSSVPTVPSWPLPVKWPLSVPASPPVSWKVLPWTAMV